MQTVFLVTGAAGHLGNTVVKQLVSEGKRVRALVLPSDQYLLYLPDAVELFIGDITDKKNARIAFQTIR